MKFELGDHLKDQISGFKGICTAKCEHLTGCRQYKLQPKGLNKDKLPLNSEWFDEEQLNKQGIKAFTFGEHVVPSSGPCDTPPERGM